MTSLKKDLITVLGPTATGKTSFAVALAKTLKSEIISADSRQVYRGMDIGTGKDLKDFTTDGYTAPHHLIDIIDAGDKYNVYQYQSDFLKAYNEIKSRDITPILCGGSGMYIDSVLKGYKLIKVPENKPLRNSLTNLSYIELKTELTKYKNLHNKSDISNKERTIRAIEIAAFNTNNSHLDLTFPTIDSVIFGIKFERDIIKKRITLRLKQRLREGMVDEVKELINNGVSTTTLEYYGLEYKFITQFLNKELSYNKMVEKLNIAIHQFSKRQTTWFRRMERQGFSINWIDGNLCTKDKVKKALEVINH